MVDDLGNRQVLRCLELSCKLFLAVLVLPWMLGLVIAMATIEPMIENFVMIWKFLIVSASVGLVVGGLGAVLEIIRETGSDGRRTCRHD